MRRRVLLAGFAAALAAGCGSSGKKAPGAEAASRSGVGRAGFDRQVALPAPRTNGPMSLEEAIGARRSRRSFGVAPLPTATIGQLLWAAQGVTAADGKRAAPSAGALYPLEIYVATVDSVAHYVPDGHRLDQRDSGDLRPQLSAAALGQDAVAVAPAVLVIAAVAGRTRVKYGARTGTYVDLEAGHAAHGVLLQAAALGLAAVPIGAFDPDRVAAALGLPSDHSVRYLLLVGEPLA